MALQGILRGTTSLLAFTSLFYAASAQAETRGYVISWLATATYVDDLKDACPNGGNGGIVEMNIRALARLPGMTVEKAREIVQKGEANGLPDEYRDAVLNAAIVNGERRSNFSYPDAVPDTGVMTGKGKTGYGFDLGSKNDANKFVDPETGQKVDNQLWRAMGCFGQFQVAPPAMPYGEELAWNINTDFAPAWLMRVTGEDLSKDGKVTVYLDRATQHLERDAAAYILRNATYVIEPTGRSHNVFEGEIKNGVLSITPKDLYLQGEMPHYAEIDLKNAQMRVHLKQDGKLEGYWGGLIDWVRHAYMFTSRPATGDAVSFYQSLKKMADFDPDPKTGQNRKISGTFRMEAVPAYIATAKGEIVASPGMPASPQVASTARGTAPAQ